MPVDVSSEALRAYHQSALQEGDDAPQERSKFPEYVQKIVFLLVGSSSSKIYLDLKSHVEAPGHKRPRCLPLFPLNLADVPPDLSFSRRGDVGFCSACDAFSCTHVKCPH